MEDQRLKRVGKGSLVVSLALTAGLLGGCQQEPVMSEESALFTADIVREVSAQLAATGEAGKTAADAEIQAIKEAEEKARAEAEAKAKAEEEERARAEAEARAAEERARAAAAQQQSSSGNYNYGGNSSSGGGNSSGGGQSEDSCVDDVILR